MFLHVREEVPGQTLEVEPRCLGIDEILDLVPGTR